MNPESDQVPDAREACLEGTPRIRDAPGGQDRQGCLRDVLHVGHPNAHEVSMGVPHARHDDGDAIDLHTGGLLWGALDGPRECNRRTVHDHTSISDWVSTAGNQEIRLDAPHDGGKRLRVNEDSGYGLRCSSELDGNPFRWEPVPRAETNHGPRKDPIELSCRRETHYRGSPVLRSHRLGGIRPPSLRRNLARLFGSGGGAPPRAGAGRTPRPPPGPGGRGRFARRPP